MSCSPCVLLLRNIHALGKDREGNDDEPRIAITMQDSISNLSNHSDWPVVTIATSSSPKDISPDMFSCFLHEVAIDTPSEEERCDMLMSVMSMARVANDVSIKQLARKTAGFVLGDFVALLSQAAREATKNTVEYYLEAGVLETEAQAPVEPEVEGAVRKLGPGDSALQSGGCTTYRYMIVIHFFSRDPFLVCATSTVCCKSAIGTYTKIHYVCVKCVLIFVLKIITHNETPYLY